MDQSAEFRQNVMRMTHIQYSLYESVFSPYLLWIFSPTSFLEGFFFFFFLHVRYINHKFSSLLAHGCLALAFPDFSGFFSCIYPGFFFFLVGGRGGRTHHLSCWGRSGLLERGLYIIFSITNHERQR